MTNYLGRGTVYQGAEKLGDVEYELQADQLEIDAGSKDGPGTIGGKKSVTGQINPLDNSGAISPSDPRQKLTLELEDGRKIDFFHNFASPKFTGGFYE